MIGHATMGTTTSHHGSDNWQSERLSAADDVELVGDDRSSRGSCFASGSRSDRFLAEGPDAVHRMYVGMMALTGSDLDDEALQAGVPLLADVGSRTVSP